MLQKNFFIIIACFAVYCSGVYSTDSIHQKTSFLESIPSQDRDFFLRHFRTLLRSECGFTLIGEKPLSSIDLAEYELIIDDRNAQKFLYYLQKLFANSSRFTLRTTHVEDSLFGGFLIDRTAFLRLHENPESDLVFETIRIGKLLGFGEENSYFYMRRNALGKFLCKVPFVWLVPMAPKYLTTQLYQAALLQFNSIQIPYKKHEHLTVTHPFSSLEEEWKWIIENENPITEWDVPPMWIRYPRYISKKGPESDALFKHYTKAANQLGKILSDEHWFDLVLELIHDDEAK